VTGRFALKAQSNKKATYSHVQSWSNIGAALMAVLVAMVAGIFVGMLSRAVK
jgi:hypothetical protein